MRKSIALLAFVSLAGCASTETVLSEPVTQTFHSTDTQTKVAFCLAN